MTGYISIFAAFGLAMSCTDDAYASSGTCEDIGLPLLQQLDHAGATCGSNLDHKTLLPLLVSFGPVSVSFSYRNIGCILQHPVSDALASSASKFVLLRTITVVLLTTVGNLGSRLQCSPRRSIFCLLAVS